MWLVFIPAKDPGMGAGTQFPGKNSPWSHSLKPLTLIWAPAVPDSPATAPAPRSRECWYPLINSLCSHRPASPLCGCRMAVTGCLSSVILCYTTTPPSCTLRPLPQAQSLPPPASSHCLLALGSFSDAEGERTGL